MNKQQARGVQESFWYTPRTDKWEMIGRKYYYWLFRLLNMKRKTHKYCKHWDIKPGDVCPVCDDFVIGY